MRRSVFNYLFALAVMFVSSTNIHAANDGVVELNDGIRFCESTYPYKDGILIANFGTEQLNPLNEEGKGYILYYNGRSTEVLVPADGNLSAPKGMFMRDNYLFISDVNKIVVYNLASVGSEPYIVRMPEGNLFVNDLVAYGDKLYVSVTNTDRIYRIDISDLSNPGKPEEWVTVPGPNGLMIADGVIYVASYPADGNTSEKNVLYRIDDFSNPSIEKFVDIPGQYDGIALSTDGNFIYFTNWVPAQVSKVNVRTGAISVVPLHLDKPLIGPADITVKNHNVYIPDLPNSRVVIMEDK